MSMTHFVVMTLYPDKSMTARLNGENGVTGLFPQNLELSV